jgi:asparagine synthase (glutamine-hydrolysing)
MINLPKATDLLSHRGPDARGVFTRDFTGLGHRRLSIIDLSHLGNQPMSDASGRYTIVYNGEIYNYKDLRKNLEHKGYSFRSDSDTEVLLYAYIDKKTGCLNDLNGFFAFAVFDEQENSLFLARDRMGIKPLYYYRDDDKFVFASEIQSILAYGLDKAIDPASLYTYLQLNYIPAPHTMVKNVRQLMPAQWMHVRQHETISDLYYQIAPAEDVASAQSLSYAEQITHLKHLLDASVRDRLVADVPVGTFLSGGIDSSVISGIAKKHKPDLHTFSIGYKDEPFFDETNYADMVAKKLATRHTVFSLGNDDLHEHLFRILDHFDQPFADSSAIPVYILCHHTAREIKVALSGDGADELFSGYNKHAAFHHSLQPGLFNAVISGLHPLWKVLPKSRNAPMGNKVRQLLRYANGLREAPPERYWMWASLMQGDAALKLLRDQFASGIDMDRYTTTKMNILRHFKGHDRINEMLMADMHLVLPDDMLKKVDLMSMAHALEVRVPFLDHRIVDFVSGLPASSKINSNMRKRILQDAYASMLPKALYRRPKKGFEVPLLKWFRTSLRTLIDDDLLSDSLVEEQGIYDPGAVRQLKKKLYSANPGDTHAHIWALIVFQWWWKKHFR